MKYETAFPSGDMTGYEVSSGMTLRDYMAAKAMGQIQEILGEKNE